MVGSSINHCPVDWFYKDLRCPRVASAAPQSTYAAARLWGRGAAARSARAVLRKIHRTP